MRYKLGGVEKASKSGENPFEALQLGAFKTKALKEQAPRGSGQRVRWGVRKGMNETMGLVGTADVGRPLFVLIEWSDKGTL